MSTSQVQEISDARLGEFDHVLVIDRSSSMMYQNKAGNPMTRWAAAQEFAIGMISEAIKVDQDGITIIFYSSQAVRIDNVKDLSQVPALFQKYSPSGSTYFEPVLSVIDDIRRNNNGKQVLVTVITDGDQSDRQETINGITRQSNSLNRDEDLSYNFIQIGDDPAAASFLEHLDNNLKGKFDIVNTIPQSKAEGLNFRQLCWLSVND